MARFDVASSTIVLVEDNPDDAHLAMIEFEDAGVRNDIVLLDDGDQAIRYLRQDAPYTDAARPGLVLLDLNLPKLDGREVLRAIKSDPDLCSIPVIVLTTSSDSTDIEVAYQNHANSFITKPTDFDEFLHAIETMHEYWLSVVRLPT